MNYVNKYDLIIKNGIVVDGSGSPPFRADIGIVGDTIVKIGDLSNTRAEKIIDASSLIVAPGFIDMHNHSDIGIFLVPTADNYIMQGVTTVVIGNCGSSPAPITDRNEEAMKIRLKKLIEKLGRIPWRTYTEYLSELDRLEKSINIAPLIGHGAIRSAVLGLEDVQPSEKELNEMKKIVAKAMENGVFGLSTGLIYVPSMYAKTWELIELAKVVSRYGGLYASHIRNEGVRLIDAVMEAITIGLESSTGVEISHLKASGIAAWGTVSTALGIIERYAARGFDVSADAYPYAASSTGLEAIFPTWVREGGTPKLIERLKQSEVIDKIIRYIERIG
ncbi:MAG TPA: aminoacylase, partial [Ignisphaera sp.]|nr:aminoacylase [Ignisphaera sp.]